MTQALGKLADAEAEGQQLKDPASDLVVVRDNLRKKMDALFDYSDTAQCYLIYQLASVYAMFFLEYRLSRATNYPNWDDRLQSYQDYVSKAAGDVAPPLYIGCFSYCRYRIFTAAFPIGFNACAEYMNVTVDDRAQRTVPYQNMLKTYLAGARLEDAAKAAKEFVKLSDQTKM